MPSAIKLLHWNINGLRAIYKKQIHGAQTFEKYIDSLKVDIIALNETKICCESMSNHADAQGLFAAYQYQYHAHATKRGYSGVSVYSKINPIRQIPTTIDDGEGRIIILEYSTFILVCVYVPNAGAKLARLDYRTRTWDKQFLKLCQRLQAIKPLVIAGDMNVAHTDIDINNPEKHRQSAGFTDVERNNFDKLLTKINLIDTWRAKHIDRIEYTYFDYRTKARDRGAGWRIDYVLVSVSIQKAITFCEILHDVYGSDHLPIMISMKI